MFYRGINCIMLNLNLTFMSTETDHVLEIEAEDYEGLVTDGCSFLVWIQGLVKETKQPVQDDRSYDLVIPNLFVNVRIK